MVVVCAGMFRSGSTWQYQVAIDLAKRARKAVWQHGCPTAADVRNISRTALDSQAVHIVKTHVPDPHLREFFEHPGFRVLYSYRDLRDVAFSMVHKIGDSFDAIVGKWGILDQCLAIDWFWSRAPGILSQRYETWTRDPRPFVEAIAEKLGIETTPEAVAEVCHEYGFQKQKERADSVAAEVHRNWIDVHKLPWKTYFDPDSLIHWNHLREGKVGHWRSLASPEQRRELFKRCGEWLVSHGYEPNDNWVNESPPAR